MPIIQIHLLKGRDQEKKRKLIAAVTDAVCFALDLPPKAVQIILLEMDPSDYAIAGKLISDQDESLSEKKK
jgi:4-oxalocrotonate tautomerase